MSFDSFKSSFLGPEALEEQKKRAERQRQEALERENARRIAEHKREEWRAFQESISGEYESKTSHDAPFSVSLNRSGGGLPSGSTPCPAGAQRPGGLKRF